MNSFQISHSAYIASVMESADTIEDTIKMYLEDAKEEIPSIDALFKSIDYFNEFVKLDDDITLESIREMLRKMKICKISYLNSIDLFTSRMLWIC